MEYYGQEALNLFVAEGNLRDRALRGAIEGKIRHFFDCIDHEKWKEVKGHLRSDAKLLDRLRDPGDIYSGILSIVAHLKGEVVSGQKIVHKLLIVDRGRVTCYVAQFSMHTGQDAIPDRFYETRWVYLIDLDEQQQIERIEIRDHNKYFCHEGDTRMMEKAIEAAEEDAMLVNCI
ncbi:hypothetical protein CDEST_09084 [Colletotrichum destructivum]|uniref:Uncharacterized protein n=1 Tax=Colletotrichum destructivum TaxID=34406 RepID=A0AAX4IKU2_9PEZI|nr:hypothetical protein CDEST_09084 [Colletotrichum destructivum]